MVLLGKSEGEQKDRGASKFLTDGSLLEKKTVIPE